MSDTRPMAEEELHAFIDERLPGERRSAVLRYLQDNPEIADRVAAYRGQREALRAALEPLGAAPIPAMLDLQHLIEQRLSRRWRPWQIAASILLAFALGGSGGWLLRGGEVPGNVTLLAEAAVANHVVYANDRRRPTELGADQRDDLVRWVSNRLNHHVAAPDLRADGFRYIGGRLAATQDGPAGLFMYDGPEGARITVFVLPVGAAAAEPMRKVQIAGLESCAWIDKGIGYTVVGKLPYPTLWHLAEQVRSQLGG